MPPQQFDRDDPLAAVGLRAGEYVHQEVDGSARLFRDGKTYSRDRGLRQLHEHAVTQGNE